MGGSMSGARVLGHLRQLLPGQRAPGPILNSCFVKPCPSLSLWECFIHAGLTIGLNRPMGLGANFLAFCTLLLCLRLALKGFLKSTWMRCIQCLRWCALGIVPLAWAGIL